MLGDHQHHFPLLLVRLIGGSNPLHPVFAEELLGRAVQHIAKVGETVLGIADIPQGNASLGALVAGHPCRLQRSDAIPAQTVEL